MIVLPGQGGDSTQIRLPLYETQTMNTSPFNLHEPAAYEAWRERKLADYPTGSEDLLVRLSDSRQLREDERRLIQSHCCKANMCLYQLPAGEIGDKDLVRRLGLEFGLEQLDRNLRADEDSITSLRVKTAAEDTFYIPYTNRPLNWHTDGYYNTAAEQVRGIVMHCAAEPASGGDNLFLDQEIAYILLRDAEPDYIDALMQPDAMTIPANEIDGKIVRPEQSGPVFSVDPQSGALHMRYTARTRSIRWKDDEITRAAVGFLVDTLKSDSAYIFRRRLHAGQGIICNNVLHKREAFTDDAAAGKERLLFRARYHDRIRGTGPYCG
jgi:alpha-ketoglutarate-dependent taurine dioxygenase